MYIMKENRCKNTWVKFRKNCLELTSKVPDLEGATTIAIPLGFKAFFKHSSNWGRPSSKKRQSAQITASYISSKLLGPSAHLINWKWRENANFLLNTNPLSTYKIQRRMFDVNRMSPQEEYSGKHLLVKSSFCYVKRLIKLFYQKHDLAMKIWHYRRHNHLCMFLTHFCHYSKVVRSYCMKNWILSPNDIK